MITGPETGLNGSSGIALDSNGNIYIANTAGSVTVYPAGSNGDVIPIATINGSNTGLNGPDGVALDSSANIYVSNHDSITIYAAGSNGNVAPLRSIKGVNTGLVAPGSIALDLSGDIYVANQFGGAEKSGSITVYTSGTNGNVAPKATISGSKTQLNFSRGIALDSSGNIYVTNFLASSVTAYPAGSDGNVAPSLTIGTPSTGLAGPAGITLDSAGNIYVTNPFAPFSASLGSITVYGAGSDADVAPIATIIDSSLFGAIGIAVDSSGNIYVTNNFVLDEVTVFKAGRSGNVGPIDIIRGPSTRLSNPLAIALDSSGDIYVVNRGRDSTPSVTTYAPGSKGDAVPVAVLGGSRTGLLNPNAITLDPRGRIYVANQGATSPAKEPSITIYSSGSNGNVAPLATIRGSNTGLTGPTGIALDAAGNIYVVNGNNSITVYPAGSNGDEAPLATISGSNTGLIGSFGIAIISTTVPTPTSTATRTPMRTPTPIPSHTSAGTPTGTPIHGATPTPIARTATGTATPISSPTPKSVGKILVTNTCSSEVTAYPIGSNGNVTPSSAVTGLALPVGIAIDASGKTYITNQCNDTVTVYPPGSNGNAAPIAEIGGPNTGLHSPLGSPWI
jgi:sugar lactone lactonase YvrE